MDHRDVTPPPRSAACAAWRSLRARAHQPRAQVSGAAPSVRRRRARSSSRMTRPSSDSVRATEAGCVPTRTSSLPRRSRRALCCCASSRTRDHLDADWELGKRRKVFQCCCASTVASTTVRLLLAVDRGGEGGADSALCRSPHHSRTSLSVDAAPGAAAWQLDHTPVHWSRGRETRPFQRCATR